MRKVLLVAILAVTTGTVSAAESYTLKQFEADLEMARQVDEASVRCNVAAPEFEAWEVGSMMYFIALCEDPRPSVTPRRRD